MPTRVDPVSLDVALQVPSRLALPGRLESNQLVSREGRSVTRAISASSFVADTDQVTYAGAAAGALTTRVGGVTSSLFATALDFLVHGMQLVNFSIVGLSASATASVDGKLFACGGGITPCSLVQQGATASLVLSVSAVTSFNPPLVIDLVNNAYYMLTVKINLTNAGNVAADANFRYATFQYALPSLRIGA